MTGHDIIVIGASAGGIQALQELVGGLPGGLPASLFVVVHTSPHSSGVLPHLLNRKASLSAEYAVDGRPIRHGRIYIAPPDHHLLLKGPNICVARGPKENGFRPAVDPLFRTAARNFGARVVAVVLSGGLDDGTTGASLVKQFGGTVIAQDPEEAPFASMPESAIQNVDVDHVLRVAQMPAVLERLALEPVPQGVQEMSQARETEPDVAEVGTDALVTGELPGPPSGFTCPGCGGALWELRDGKLLRFRCHVGHGYTAESLMAEQSNGLEVALWTALRALEENANLQRRMAERAQKSNHHYMLKKYLDDAKDTEARAAVIRKVLVSEPREARHFKGVTPKRGRPGHKNSHRTKPNPSPRKPGQALGQGT